MLDAGYNMSVRDMVTCAVVSGGVDMARWLRSEYERVITASTSFTISIRNKGEIRKKPDLLLGFV